MQKYAQVIIDINHSAVDRIFEYKIPDELACAGLETGMRVKVPFGQGNKLVEGYIVGLSDVCSFDEARIKCVAQKLEDYSVLRAEQIDMAYWMRDEYCCSLVDALRLMIPAQLRNDKIRIKTATAIRLQTHTQEELDTFLRGLNTKSGKCKAPKQREVIELLRDLNCEVFVRDVVKHIPRSEDAIRKLAGKNVIEMAEREVLRSPFTTPALAGAQNDPTQKQMEIIERVIASIDNGGEQFLLHGVTGSGKTEVYMRCISHCIEKGKTAIMLVPEIALTPQTVGRFRERFRDQVAVLHSRLSAGERYDEWRRIRFGAVKVVVGARSAVFAPFDNLGLIVVDEEHESSYKSDKTPRYDAIDVARKRCQTQSASLMLGSATPSLESYYKMQKGEYRLLRLNERINNRPLPKVKIVDMRTEFASGNKRIFSAALYAEIKNALARKNQIILFMNRRGYSSFVSCRGCGYVIKCPHCDISLTYHKKGDKLRCHYCHYEIEQYSVCPECNKPYLKHFGVGTQQVQEQFMMHFPGARTLRMDYDTTQTKNAHENILAEFSEGKADVLIGTQMIAKGLDFPQVTLVGVIAADASLFVPDYRSAERTFSLLTQVEGRAGRDINPGRVIVQTYAPNNPSILFAARHDYSSFYRYEIKMRAQNQFPPFADFLRFVFVGKEDEELAKRCELAKAEIQSLISVTVNDPRIEKELIIFISATRAPIQYIKDEIRYQLLIKIKRNELSSGLIKRIAGFAREKYAQGMPNLEINPQSMT